MTSYPLTIGPVTIGGQIPQANLAPFEAPNGDQGGLSDLGSKQKAVVHEFAGGEVTAQVYGSFPKPIAWKGKLFGQNAISRSFELQKLCDNAQVVTLQWAQWSFDGFVEDYKVTVLGPNEIDYEITFRPLVNNATVTGGNAPPIADPFSSTLTNAQNTATQQANNPASGGTLPPQVAPQIQSLNSGINNALQQSNGSLSNIPPATLQTLQGQISTTQSALQPVINGTDPQAASAAADLNGTLGIMSASLGNGTTPLITTIQVANPNFYALSSQYYGTPTLYWAIAAANNLFDPLPTTNGPISIKIPVKPIITSVEPPTVMTDALANVA